VPWWVRILPQPSLFEALEDFSDQRTEDKLANLSRWIFNPSEGDHSIFVADSNDEVRRITVAFALAHPEKLQARAVAWGPNADLDFLRKLGKVCASPATTPDTFVNDRHYDICGASDNDRSMLVERLALHGFRERFRLNDIKDAARHALVESGRIDRATLTPNMIRYLEEVGIL
jgi:hypothetical protein